MQVWKIVIHGPTIIHKQLGKLCKNFLNRTLFNLYFSWCKARVVCACSRRVADRLTSYPSLLDLLISIPSSMRGPRLWTCGNHRTRGHGHVSFSTPRTSGSSSAGRCKPSIILFHQSCIECRRILRQKGTGLVIEADFVGFTFPKIHMYYFR